MRETLVVVVSRVEDGGGGTIDIHDQIVEQQQPPFAVFPVGSHRRPARMLLTLYVVDETRPTRKNTRSRPGA